ncbi:MAG: 3-oxoacyl-ACP reductase [Planctomycetaceae bacterium]|nr:3-oxoacyl-ACP reductase [Planctomycetaceae bacterium]
MSLTNKTVLVTGASRGFGLAIAKAMLTAEATVIGWGRDAKALGDAQQTLEAIGGSFTLDVVDVTDESVVAERIAALPRLDVLINNAGIARCRPLFDTPTQELRNILDVNVIGAFNVMREAARLMVKLGAGGLMINIASDAAVRGIGNMAPYCASKHALLGLGRSVAQELRNTGVRITTFCPGGIATNILGPGGEDNPHAMDPDELAASVVQIAELSARIEVQEFLVLPMSV